MCAITKEVFNDGVVNWGRIAAVTEGVVSNVMDGLQKGKWLKNNDLEFTIIITLMLITWTTSQWIKKDSDEALKLFIEYRRRNWWMVLF